jgi:serine/threonine protein kinase
MRDNNWLVNHTLDGRYRIVGVLGSGGFGTVYDAFDGKLQRPVAVKVLMPEGADADAVQALFQREAIVSAQPQHPNVVRVHDAGTDRELHLDFLVMERLQGCNLAQFLAKGRPTYATATSLLQQAADGLAAGHRAGLIHRDIKPGNLFVSESPGRALHLHVLDFGIARWADSDTSDTSYPAYVGPHTARYASPEQLRGQKLTPASDVYSLGLVGVELLGGTVPEPGAWIGDVRDAVLPTLPSTVPASMIAILGQALAPTAAERFRAAGEFLDALHGVPNAAESGRGESTQSLAAPDNSTLTFADAGVRTKAGARSLGDAPFAGDHSNSVEPHRTPNARTPIWRGRNLVRLGSVTTAFAAIAVMTWLQIGRTASDNDANSASQLVDSARTGTAVEGTQRLVSATDEPHAKLTQEGEYTLELPSRLQQAVDAFLAPRGSLRMAEWADASADGRAAMKEGRLQYPFALWQDLDSDGDLDVALVFVSTSTTNNWQWRDWHIVVFRAWPDGHFDDLSVTTVNGSCFDGMIYVPTYLHVEYGCFEVAVGAFAWNGRGFSVETAMGD